MLLAATAGAICCYGGSAEAKTTFLPDWQGAGLEGKSSNESNMDLNRDEKLCMEQNAEFKYYTSAQCPKYYALDETCDIDTHYLDCNPVRWCLENDYKVQSCSDPDKHLYNQCPNNYPYYQKCVCNSQFRYTSSNCNGQYYLAGSSCTDDRSSTKKYTQCICSPKSSETGCSCTTSCSDGCGGTRTCCTSCPPPPTPPSTSSGGSSGGGGGGGSDPLSVPAPEDPTFHSNKGLGYVVATSDPSEPETTPYEPVMISAEDKTTEVNRESMQLSNNAKMWVYNPDTFGYDTILLSDLIDFDKDINSYTKYIRVGMRAYNDSVVINDTEQTILSLIHISEPTRH